VTPPGTTTPVKSTTTLGAGGTLTVPPEATLDTELATTTTHVPAGTVLIDVQNHLLDYVMHPDAADFTGFPQAACGEDDPRMCFSPEQWADLVFQQSDTTMAVLSAIPVVGAVSPLSIDAMENGKQVAASLCGDGRVLIQGHAVPNVGPIDAALESMSAVAAEHQISAWKVYTHAGPGWYFDDHDPGAAQVGERFLAHVEAIGVDVVAVHKGLSGGSPFASPVDIGPAAVRHPGIAFVVYHSGYEHSYHEAEFNPQGGGVDRLVATVQAAGIAPGGNVYAELGSTWRAVMGDLDQAAHLLGKLLVAVGEDNIVWGTDSIWYGSPQDQIAAFRAFEITPEYQERFGYPELTTERKAKILGLNAARVFGITNPVAHTCGPAEQGFRRAESPYANALMGPVTRRDIVRTFVRDHPWVRE
jgi:predicted TIM-barrel fold metal-dependent hydrolase